jgi:hypothetical protein
VQQIGARCVWAIVLGPSFDLSDAQNNLLLGDAVTLHATLALCVAGATGGPSPALPLPPNAPSDALACIAGPAALAPFGVPQHIAAAYEMRLRSAVHQPKDARSAFIDVCKAMRAANGLSS